MTNGRPRFQGSKTGETVTSLTSEMSRKRQALPDDDLVLPEGHQINLDESDDKTPEDARAEERWPGSLEPVNSPFTVVN